MKRIVHYVNQFFAGQGGEESASLPPGVLEGAVGPGKAAANSAGRGRRHRRYRLLRRRPLLRERGGGCGPAPGVGQGGRAGPAVRRTRLRLGALRAGLRGGVPGGGRRAGHTGADRHVAVQPRRRPDPARHPGGRDRRVVRRHARGPRTLGCPDRQDAYRRGRGSGQRGRARYILHGRRRPQGGAGQRGGHAFPRRPVEHAGSPGAAAERAGGPAAGQARGRSDGDGDPAAAVPGNRACTGHPRPRQREGSRWSPPAAWFPAATRTASSRTCPPISAPITWRAGSTSPRTTSSPCTAASSPRR